MKTSIFLSGMVLAGLGIAALNFPDLMQDNYHVTEVLECKKPKIEDPLLATTIGPENNYSDFFYDMGTRFSPIPKSKLSEATSARDFLDKDLTEHIHSYELVSISIFESEELSSKRREGTSENLTEDQLSFIRSLDYSTNFVVRVDFLQNRRNAGEPFKDYRSPHMTVVPEKQAYYKPGKEQLLEYLKFGNKEKTLGLNEDELQPAKLFFTVTRDGSISNIRLDLSSGYADIDENIIELLKSAPGQWVPAENSKCMTVDQELVIFFGLMGC